MTRRTTLLALFVVLVLIGAVAVAAVVGGNDTADTTSKFTKPTPATDGVPSGLEDFYSQKLSWDDCDRAKCTTVKVPVDYEKPDGETLKLRVKVVPAKGDGGHSLFLNPGGPGGEALGFADYMKSQFGDAVLDRYDLVGVDPRGVGKSTPIDCLSDRAAGRICRQRARPRRPGRDREVPSPVRRLRPRMRAAVRRPGFARLHRGGRPRLRRHPSTARTPRRFDWYGASYGTQLGATYATLFPKRVGRMVLDGATDPTLTAEESAFGQTTGFERALDAYIKDCVKKADVPARQRRRRRGGQARHVRRSPRHGPAEHRGASAS